MFLHFLCSIRVQDEVCEHLYRLNLNTQLRFVEKDAESSHLKMY